MFFSRTTAMTWMTTCYSMLQRVVRILIYKSSISCTRLEQKNECHGQPNERSTNTNTFNHRRPTRGIIKNGRSRIRFIHTGESFTTINENHRSIDRMYYSFYLLFFRFYCIKVQFALVKHWKCNELKGEYIYFFFSNASSEPRLFSFCSALN